MIFCLSCKKHTKDINPIGKLTRNNNLIFQLNVIFVKNQKVNLFLLKKLKGMDFFQTYLNIFQC